MPPSCVPSRRPASQQGNVLFLILIAVVLFAALSYAVTNSSRTGSGNVGGEKAGIQAATIMQMASALEQTVTRLRVTNKCAIEELNFATTRYTRAGQTNAAAPASKKCDVFDPAGGGAVWRNCDPKRCPDPYIYDPLIAGNLQVPGIGTTTNTPASVDILYVIPVTLEVCLALNRKLSLPVTDLNIVNWGSVGLWNGTFTGAEGFNPAAPSYPSFVGKASGCTIWHFHAERVPMFYHVLVAR